MDISKIGFCSFPTNTGIRLCETLTDFTIIGFGSPITTSSIDGPASGESVPVNRTVLVSTRRFSSVCAFEGFATASTEPLKEPNKTIPHILNKAKTGLLYSDIDVLICGFFQPSAFSLPPSLTSHCCKNSALSNCSLIMSGEFPCRAR